MYVRVNNTASHDSTVVPYNSHVMDATDRIDRAEQFREAKDVKTFYELGLRCAQLTYNSQNLIGTGATDRIDGGVSDFGAEIIAAMNEAGMLVDVSHCGPKTTLDAIEIANRLPYGLCSYAFTNSQARSFELANRVESGIMSLNHFGTSQADTPFGGVKESGYGREGGYETLDAFMITKFISQKITA